MRKIIHKISLILICLVVVSAYISGSYSAQEKFKFLYYKYLFTPKVSSEDLVANMSNMGFVSEQSDDSFVKSLIKEVYNGNEDVIDQLTHNIANEVTKTKTLLQGNEYEIYYTINGLSYSLLYEGATWATTTPFMMNMAILAAETEDTSLFEKMCEFDLVYIYSDNFQHLEEKKQKEVLFAFFKLLSYNQNDKLDEYYRNLILSTSKKFYLTEYSNIDEMLRLAKIKKFDDAYNMYVLIVTPSDNAVTVMSIKDNVPNLKRLLKENKLDKILN